MKRGEKIKRRKNFKKQTNKQIFSCLRSNGLFFFSVFLCWTPTERASRLCLAQAEKPDKRWFTLDDSPAQLPDLHSEFVCVNITMSFYMSPCTYGSTSFALYLALLSQPLDPCFTEYLYIHVHTLLTLFCHYLAFENQCRVTMSHGPRILPTQTAHKGKQGFPAVLGSQAVKPSN